MSVMMIWEAVNPVAKSGGGVYRRGERFLATATDPRVIGHDVKLIGPATQVRSIPDHVRAVFDGQDL